MAFWVYILRCADGSYYTGHSDDMELRLAQHDAGHFPDCYTFKRRPLELVFAQETDSRASALESEHRIKGWSRAKKEALIASDWQGLSSLAKRRTDRRQADGKPLQSHACNDVVQFEGQAGLQTDLKFMQRALELADRAEREDDEIPVGALVVDAGGKLVGEGWNRNIAEHDPSAHAEIVAMREAGRALDNHRLIGCTLYVTLEPCAMCAMAMVHARLARVVYAASDPKTGAAGSVFDLLADPRHNHRVQVQAGVLADEAGSRLREYFRRRRGKPASS